MYFTARLYNTTPLVFTSATVEKQVPSPSSPSNPTFLRTYLGHPTGPVRFPTAPEDRLHTPLDQLPHSPLLQAGSTLLGTLRSALRDRSPSGLHPRRPPRQASSLGVEGCQAAYTALREHRSCCIHRSQSISVFPSPPLIVLTTCPQIPVCASSRSAPAF